MIPQIKTITNIRNPFLLVMEIMIKIIEQTYFPHYQSGTKFQKKMYGIRRYFIGVNNKKDNYFCYSL